MEDLAKRVEQIEKQLDSKQIPVGVEVVATKASLKKMKEAIIRVLHF